MRTVREIYDVLFAFAPERMKMGDWDNVGLLCGRFTTEVETVLVALDPLPDVIAEAVELGAQCIVTHHPLFFDPPRAINETTLAGRSVLELIEHGIAAVNLHTNLDCAPGGVNDALAATSEHAREFMVVGKDDGLSDSCPALSVQFFPGKKSLAEAVIAKERERLVAFADAKTKLIEQQAVIAAL